MIGIVCAFFHTEGKGFYSKLLFLKKEIKFCFISSGFNIFISELILSPLPPTYLFYCSMLIYVLSNE